MAHLIDKDTILAEIESLLDKGKYHEEYDCAYRDGNNGALYTLKGRINTLEVKEVDLEKEFCDYLEKNFRISMTGILLSNNGEPVNTIKLFDFAKHFFELGIKAQRESVSIQNVDDILKELGVNPYSKEAKKLKDSYYAAMDKFLAQKGEEV